jgi:putative redox protein
MQLTKFEIPNAGGQPLAAQLDLPGEGGALAFALLAHCFTCTKDLKAFHHLSRALTGKGFAVLRFDFTGLGGSGGEFADTSLSTNVADLQAAAAFLAERFEAPRLLIGHSFGGAAVIRAAPGIESVRAVATIAAPADPRHVSAALGDATEELDARGQADVRIAGRMFTLRRSFLEDLGRIDPEAALRGLNRPLLVLHSPVDDVVGIENAARIFKAARHPKSFVSLDTADHLLSDAADARYAGEVIAAWALRYIVRPAE